MKIKSIPVISTYYKYLHNINLKNALIQDLATNCYIKKGLINRFNKNN